MTFHHYLYSWSKPYWRLIGEDEELTPLLPAIPQDPIPIRHIYYFKQEIKGPHSLQEMNLLFQQQKLSLFDPIFVEEEGSWCRMLESPLFKHLLPEKPATAPWIKYDEGKELLSGIIFDTKGLEANIASISDETDEDKSGKKNISLKYDETLFYEVQNEPIWMVVKADHLEKYLGPYRYIEVSRMIKSGLLGAKDRVKKINEDIWYFIGDVHEFRTKMVRKMVKVGPELIQKILVARRHRRIFSLGQAKIHLSSDRNRSNYNGTCSTLSEGGCFIETRVKPFSLSQVISVKLLTSRGDDSLTVEAKGKIIGIKNKSPQGISVEFVETPKSEIEKIRNFIKNCCLKDKVGESL